MEFSVFKQIFESKIYEDTRSGLIESIAKRPERFVGVFRSTPVREKIAQFVSQSREIKFGDAFEELIGKLLEERDYVSLPKILVSTSGQTFNADQLVRDQNGNVYLIEQKIRDDHDTTKRIGQIDNFRDKVLALQSANGTQFKKGFFYFIDPEFKKNKAYYQRRLSELELELGVQLPLVYGSELFDELGIESLWAEVLNHLTNWRNGLPTFATFNFDDAPDQTVAEFKANVPASLFIKLFKNAELRDNVLPILFTSDDTLLKVREIYARSVKRVDKELCILIDEFIELRRSNLSE